MTSTTDDAALALLSDEQRHALRRFAGVGYVCGDVSTATLCATLRQLAVVLADCEAARIRADLGSVDGKPLSMYQIVDYCRTSLRKCAEERGQLGIDRQRLTDELAATQQKYERLKHAHYKSAHEVEQILGKVLGYPWYKDDPKNFPDATERDGVCVGEHVPETLAEETARTLTALRAQLAQAERERDAEYEERVRWATHARGVDAASGERIAVIEPHNDWVSMSPDGSWGKGSEDDVRGIGVVTLAPDAEVQRLRTELATARAAAETAQRERNEALAAAKLEHANGDFHAETAVMVKEDLDALQRRYATLHEKARALVDAQILLRLAEEASVVTDAVDARMKCREAQARFDAALAALRAVLDEGE